MRIALTGATGFLGRYLIARLTADGHQVSAWCRGEPPAELATDVEWIRGELGNPIDAERLVESADAVVHSGLARQGVSFLDSGDDPINYWEVNATGSLRLLEAAHRAGVERFVFISSGAVHDDVLPDRPLDETHPLRPNTLYGAYKASVETLVHHYGAAGKLCTATLRPTAIYGVASPVTASKWFELIKRIRDGQDVTATGGSKAVHASDVADAAAMLLSQDDSISGETYNCCDRMISDFEVASIAKRLTDSPSTISGQPKVAKHEIDTSKIRSIGMEFGDTALLEQTIAAMLATIDHD